MRWSEELDGSHVVGDDERQFVIRRVHIPYPDDCPAGLKLLTGWFWRLETYEDGSLVNAPHRLFDKLDDAKRAVGRRLGDDGETVNDEGDDD